MKQIDYRLNVYTVFANKAKKANLKWVVAHGSEGFPFTIGRDLDCLCFDKENILKAVNLFKESAISIKETKWVIEPNPIWGKRVLAISKNYEVAELHILWKLNSGLIDLKIDWNSVNDDLFPHNENVTVFKSLIMPILGGSKKVLKNDLLQIVALPFPFKRIVEKIKSNERITFVDKLFAYFSVERNPIRLIKNMQYAKKIASKISECATTPLVLIRDNQKEVLKSVCNNLDEIFLDFINGDLLASEEIAIHQSRQRLVYFFKQRNDVKMDYEITNENSMDLDSLVSAFAQYNRENEYV